MVYITEQLIRTRAEHNNGELSTLEEVSLHQLDIEKIEFIDKWCRHLKILYLQSNLIGRIENVSKLKELEYLNLALNNVLKIENLQSCESLNKLDLTVNFIGELTSISCLRRNEFLRELYLTGNPCTDYLGYRDFVIATLPHLTHLDGTEINKSERIEAIQKLESIKCDVIKQQKNYFEKLKKENEGKSKAEGEAGFNNEWYTDTENAHLQKQQGDGEHKESSNDDDFWNKPTKYTPESRLETHRYMEEQRKEKEKEKGKFADPNPPKRNIRYFNDDGRPFNINQAQVEFKWSETDEYVTLDVACFKHLDTSLLDVDIQPSYIRVTIKDKILQLVLSEEIAPDSSSAQRSQTTGHLLVTMKKLSFKLEKNIVKATGNKVVKATDNTDMNTEDVKRNFEKLEVCDNKRVDIYNIVASDNNKKHSKSENNKKIKDEIFNEVQKLAAEEFVDNPDVPPLM